LVKQRTKGNRAVQKCITFLESNGCEACVVERVGRFIKVKDMFGLFDLVSIHPKGGLSFIQVTCNTPHSHKKYQQFTDKYWLAGVTVQQWVWVDYKGFTIYSYCKGVDKPIKERLTI